MRQLSVVLRQDRFALDGIDAEYRSTWNAALDHVARECIAPPDCECWPLRVAGNTIHRAFCPAREGQS